MYSRRFSSCAALGAETRKRLPGWCGRPDAGGFAQDPLLKPCSAAVFMPFLKENFPQLVADYEMRFKDRAFLPAACRKRISELFARLCVKHGIRKESRWSWDNQLVEKEQQMSLF